MQGYILGDYHSRFFKTLVLSHPTARLSVLVPPWRLSFFLLVSLMMFSGCMSSLSHYARIEASLRNGDPEQADQLLALQEEAYGTTNRLLYLMDRGMTLHLAGHYVESNQVLEEADRLIEDLYTRRLRNEAMSFLLNDTTRPFRGDPYEQVMVNVIKRV